MASVATAATPIGKEDVSAPVEKTATRITDGKEFALSCDLSNARGPWNAVACEAKEGTYATPEDAAAMAKYLNAETELWKLRNPSASPAATKKQMEETLELSLINKDKLTQKAEMLTEKVGLIKDYIAERTKLEPNVTDKEKSGWANTLAYLGNNVVSERIESIKTNGLAGLKAF